MTPVALVTDSVAVSTRGDSHMIDLTAQVQRWCADTASGRAGPRLRVRLHRRPHHRRVRARAPEGPARGPRAPGPPRAALRARGDVARRQRPCPRAGELLGPSLTVPFRDGRLLLGTCSRSSLLDFDTAPASARSWCSSAASAGDRGPVDEGPSPTPGPPARARGRRDAPLGTFVVYPFRLFVVFCTRSPTASRPSPPAAPSCRSA